MTRSLILEAPTAILCLLATIQAAAQISAAEPPLVSTTSNPNTKTCIPTTPETHNAVADSGNADFRNDGTFGNESLYTILGSRIVFRPGGPGFVLPDGSLAMKYMWWRLRNGQLTIEGRKVDEPSAPLRARIPDGYGETGFQSTSIIFPDPGCWEVTGRIGDDSITFIVLVEKIGDGPCGRVERSLDEAGGQVALTAWHEERITDSMHGLRKLRVSGEREYEGGKLGIRGSGKFSFITTYQPGRLTTFVGDEQIAATIGEKTGTFVIHHNGTIENGIARSTWAISESSGTEELASIAGHGTYSSGLDDKACYSVIYSGI